MTQKIFKRKGSLLLYLLKDLNLCVNYVAKFLYVFSFVPNTLKLTSSVTSVSRFHATGSGFEPGAGQGWFILSSFGCVDKISNKFVWKINTQVLSQADLLSRAWAYGTPGLMVTKTIIRKLEANALHRLISWIVALKS